MLRLANKDNIIAIISIFHVFKELSRDMEDLKETQIKLLEIETIVFKMKNTLIDSWQFKHCRKKD